MAGIIGVLDKLLSCISDLTPDSGLPDELYVGPHVGRRRHGALEVYQEGAADPVLALGPHEFLVNGDAIHRLLAAYELAHRPEDLGVVVPREVLGLQLADH